MNAGWRGERERVATAAPGAGTRGETAAAPGDCCWRGTTNTGCWIGGVCALCRCACRSRISSGLWSLLCGETRWRRRAADGLKTRGDVQIQDSTQRGTILHIVRECEPLTAAVTAACSNGERQHRLLPTVSIGNKHKLALLITFVSLCSSQFNY